MRNTDYSVIEEPNKVYILGSKGVGKTSFMRKLFNFSFDEKIASTEIGIQTSRLNMENKFFTIKELTDNDDFKCTPIFKNDIEQVLIIFIIFSLTDKESCEYMKRLIEIIGHSIIGHSPTGHHPEGHHPVGHHSVGHHSVGHPPEDYNPED